MKVGTPRKILTRSGSGVLTPTAKRSTTVKMESSDSEVDAGTLEHIRALEEEEQEEKSIPPPSTSDWEAEEEEEGIDAPMKKPIKVARAMYEFTVNGMTFSKNSACVPCGWKGSFFRCSPEHFATTTHQNATLQYVLSKQEDGKHAEAVAMWIETIPEKKPRGRPKTTKYEEQEQTERPPKRKVENGGHDTLKKPRRDHTRSTSDDEAATRRAIAAMARGHPSLTGSHVEGSSSRERNRVDWRGWAEYMRTGEMALPGWCIPCNSELTSSHAVQQHLSGSRHINAAKREEDRYLRASDQRPRRENYRSDVRRSPSSSVTFNCMRCKFSITARRGVHIFCQQCGTSQTPPSM